MSLAELAHRSEINEKALDFVALGVANALGGSLSGAERLFRLLRPRSDHSIVARAAVAAGTTQDPAWAAPLAQLQPLASGFIALLRPRTIFDGLQSRMRRAPFQTRFPRQTGGGSVGWQAEGKPAIVSALNFELVSFGPAKLGGVAILSAELARFASPDALSLVQDDLLAATSEATDRAFLDPASAGVPGQAPPSITHTGPQVPASGADATAYKTDASDLIAQMAARGCQFQSPVWAMSEVQRAGLALADPLLIGGGELLGWPIMTSAVAATSTSPPTGNIYLLDAAQITFGDAGAEIDGSQEAAIQMNTAPDDPVTSSTVVRPLWQSDLAAVKISRFLNWQARAGCPAGSIVGASYGVA